MERIAKELRDVDRVLDPRPLESQEDLKAWYRGEEQLQDLRGHDVAKTLAVTLDRGAGAPPCKAFVMGRSGVGKSTELTRLSTMVEHRYQTLRFSVRDQLDPKNFTAFDVLLLICVILAEETQRVTDRPPEPAIILELLDWYADRDESVVKETKVAMEAAAGADTKGTWWDKVVGAFVTLKGGIQFAQSRKEEVVAYKLKRIPPLIEIANRLIRNCDDLLDRHSRKEWLILGEDADKPGMDLDRVNDLFLVHGNSIFGGLEANLIFNLPLGLTFGAAAQELPTLPRYTIYDVPVYHPDRTSNEETITFMQKILDARLAEDLFDDMQSRRLIIAAGANLRDLFSMVRHAAIEARSRGAASIGSPDVDRVIQTFRVEFQKRLGTTSFDTNSISPEDKIDRLVRLFRAADTGAEVLDDVLGEVVGTNVVQEFNGKHWYAVHPLIVDVLVRMDRIKNPQGGTV